MPPITVEQAMRLARQHHQAGQLAQAEALYRQILQEQPHHADALHLLGVLTHQLGRSEAALDLIGRAIAINPHFAGAWGNRGNILQALGRFDEAIAACNQALVLNPRFPAAYINLGNALQAKGQLHDAIAAYRRAIALDPKIADAHNNLGNALQANGQFDAAVEAYRLALTLNPSHPEARSNLGNALQARGLFDEAIVAHRRAIALKPSYSEAHNNLGIALKAKGHLDESIAAHRQAIALNPNYPEALNNLGNALQAKGQLDEAIAAYRQAVVIRPRYPSAYNNLGVALQAKGQFDEAIAAHRQAIALKSHYAEAFSNLGNALRECGKLDEAVAAFRDAIALNPDHPEAHNNLGNGLKDRGELDAAVTAYRQASALAPNNAVFGSNLVYALHFHPAYDAEAIAAENRRWDVQYAKPLRECVQPFSIDPSPDRRLRIGYVSPDFRDQAESFFTVPLLENHDHTVCEVCCYSSVIRPDHISARLQRQVDIWRDVRGESDEALAEIIRRDQIDILVDLTMHMSGNRALVFARKPAPVQACWLAYPGSTGMETMDYRITDSWMDPPDADVSCYAEESIRLPDCWVVYDPLIDLPPGHREQRGSITFGSLNYPAKLNDPVLMLWARVLLAIPGSRLLMQVASAEHRQRIGRRMESLGVSPDRLEFVGRMTRPDYLRCYDRIDIALDPLPYNGITTTCDALYMGTPVLTLAGQTAPGRAGKAMLSTIGLEEWIANTPGEFVEKAAHIASDRSRLMEVRRGLRARLTASPLMDAPRFARSMEAAYRQMWRAWCRR